MVVVHVYNPSYSGGKDHKDHGLRSAQGKKLVTSHLNTTMWVLVAHTCDLTFAGRHRQEYCYLRLALGKKQDHI
jgi:hypothetical protein